MKRFTTGFWNHMLKSRKAMLLLPALLVTNVINAQSASEALVPSQHFDTLFYFLVVVVILLLAIIMLIGRSIIQVGEFKIKEMRSKKMLTSVILLLCTVLQPFSSHAATSADLWIYILAGTAILEIAVIFFLLNVFRKLSLSVVELQMDKAVVVELAQQEKEKEAKLLMKDHEYDGIHELDNDLPPWWKYLFYVTIAFGVLYLLHYHVWKSGNLQAKEYENEMELATAQKNQTAGSGSAAKIDENTVTVLTDAAEMEKGKTIFTTSCGPCHGSKGEGGVGPNMTDEYWLHGGSINNIFKTIKYGVPEKGMVSWQQLLNPQQMQQVASYIKSLAGTNPPNPKAPQGDKYVEEQTGEGTHPLPGGDSIVKK